MLPLPVFVSAQDVSTGQDFRVDSPVQSSSAPSTASCDIKEQLREVARSFDTYHAENFFLQIYDSSVRILERSYSEPSIANEDKDVIEEEEHMIVETQNNDDVGQGQEYLQK